MAHIQLAVNEQAFNKLVYGAANALSHVSPLHFNGNLGSVFSLDLTAGFKLIPGNIVDLKSNGTIVIDKLQILYNPLILTFGIDIGPISIPSYCFDVWGFSVCTPEIPIIPRVPIVVPIDLSGLVVSSYRGEFSLRTAEQTLAARAGIGNHRAHATPDTSNEIQTRILSALQSDTFIGLLPNSVLTSIASQLTGLIKGNLADKIQFYLQEGIHDIELIDIGETVKNILQGIANRIIDTIFSWVPSDLLDIARGLLSDVIDAISTVLELPEDLQWWLENQLHTNLGLLNTVSGIVTKLLSSIIPVYQFENPYPLIEDSSGLIPVLIGVDKLTTVIDENEFVISANISNV